jgi:DNA-binding transcriptional MerR regulator
MKNDGSLLRIGEVAEIIEVPIHTLRYWERMFKEELNPYRSRGGQRRYSEMDVEKIREVKRLIKEEGYSIKGVKRILVNGVRNKEPLCLSAGREPDWSAITQAVTRLLREKCYNQ